MQSLRFPWSLTKISKLPHPHINRIAEEFLNEEFGPKHLAARKSLSDRHNTLKTYRLVIRLLAEMQLCGAVALCRLVGQDYLGGNALVALLAEAGRVSPDLLVSGSDRIGRPITIRAMARSFNRPYETMRRALHRLSQLELVELSDDGVTLKGGVINRPDVQNYLVEMHDIMVTLLEDLFVFAKLPAPSSFSSPSQKGLISLASLDLHLLSAEGMQGIFTDWTGLMVVSAIVAGNVRNVTYHPELAFSYAAADQIPPMRLRKPVHFKALCEALPICPTTAWRRVTAMKMLGSIKTVDGGLIVDSKWLNNSSLTANACDRIERMHSIISRMASSGVPLNNIEDLYIRGRSAPLTL